MLAESLSGSAKVGFLKNKSSASVAMFYANPKLISLPSTAEGDGAETAFLSFGDNSDGLGKVSFGVIRGVLVFPDVRYDEIIKMMSAHKTMTLALPSLKLEVKFQLLPGVDEASAKFKQCAAELEKRASGRDI